MTGYEIKRTAWGFSLFHDGELVASADDAMGLFALVAAIRQHDPARS